MKCDCCEGTGLVSILQNPECLFDGFETPIYIEEACNECCGTGNVDSNKDSINHSSSNNNLLRPNKNQGLINGVTDTSYSIIGN